MVNDIQLSKLLLMIIAPAYELLNTHALAFGKCFVQKISNKLKRVYGRKKASETENPSALLWSGPLGSEKELKLNLEIQDGVYMLMGPLPPQDQMAEQWEPDEMYHTFEVNGEQAR